MAGNVVPEGKATFDQANGSAKTGEISGGSLSELKAQGQKVLHSPHHAPILLVYDDGDVYAVDNRCPHMGFPLARGSVDEGILTCHWHHARFCLASGGTFDPFADDLRTYPVRLEGDDIWIELAEGGNRRDYWLGRLRDGLQHGLNLVIAKAVTALIDLGVEEKDIVYEGARFGCFNRRAWGPGLTVLTAMANLSPHLPREDRIVALYQGLVHVSRDTRGQPPRFSLGPLSGMSGTADPTTVDRHMIWFRHFVDVRDEDGAERTLLTAISQGVSPEHLVDMLLSAATDHVYLDVGHVVDFINKSCELLDLIGWDEAQWVLPTVIPLLCNAQRSEELASWRRPVDLIKILNDATERLEHIAGPASAGGTGVQETDEEGGIGEHQPSWSGDVKALADAFLSEDPSAGLNALLHAYETGATPEELARALALAAAQRVLYFHVQNEFSDWDAVHHTFTYANALHQLLRRAPSSAGMRGLLHGVLRVYLDRFLNVPKARTGEAAIEAERRALSNGQTYGPRLEGLLNGAGQVEQAAALTMAAYEHAADASSVDGDMWAALVRTVVREDAAFHTLQMVEAARRQFTMAADAHRPIPMVAASRYIAAHAPTHRELLQTARVAMRLQAGEILHEE